MTSAMLTKIVRDDRVIIPLSSYEDRGTQSSRPTRITSSPRPIRMEIFQNLTFRPTQLVICNPTLEDFVVEDIRIGGRPQFPDPDGIPGLRFGPDATASPVEFDVVRGCADSIVIVVRRTSRAPSFVGILLGRTLSGDTSCQ